MKKNNLLGLMALSLLCLISTPFSAQAPDSLPLSTESTDPNSVFEYTDISLSDPSIYANEPFSISLTVKNNGDQEAKHEVRLMLKDATIPEGIRRQARQDLSLRPGETTTVTFTFKASDLMEAQESMPEKFIFLLGEYEIGVGYEK